METPPKSDPAPPGRTVGGGEAIWILDFGSQYTQLIARRVRELGVFSRVAPCTVSPGEVDWSAAKGLIFSGGPASVIEAGAPECDPRFFSTDLPKLGICYGLQLYGKTRGGQMTRSQLREFGRARFVRAGDDPLLAGLPESFNVWMSHGDTLTGLPVGMEAIGATSAVPLAAAVDRPNHFWGLQFHPEVEHTEHGRDILKAFLYTICGCRGGWNEGVFIDQAIAAVRGQVGDGHVLLGVSGGVDSAVLAVLLQRAIGDRAHPVFVDTGLLRDAEVHQVQDALLRSGVKVHAVDAAERFLAALSGTTDPEQKRKTIGRVFIEVFESEARRIGHVDFLAQGTLYPDWIESVSVRGPSSVIKSHHNVGGLPEHMKLELVEPLKWLFKDEVRAAGRRLGLPDSVIGRHPFPGPGLAVRILGPVTRPDLDLLRKADSIYLAELRRAGLYDRIWQAFCVLLPIRSVGVMGDERTYERVLGLRAVTSTDGMTADWAELPYDLLKTISNRLINEVPGINRVVYDVSSKPPATIEWE
ncbi:MAG: glutamine-hydrolyzing GMP synthase [candidate division Zixibacteria bacterium]|nr:glutamine-hydrolyzing GMP synthase [candidate division Zixibacteria bacterium]